MLPHVPAEQARCRVAASQSSPLVTEWPASEKANLEVLAARRDRRGRVLGLQHAPAARVPRGAASTTGSRRRPRPIRWRSTTPTSCSRSCRSARRRWRPSSSARASCPSRPRSPGQLRLQNANFNDIPREGPCAQATHIVTGLSLGAFALTAGGQKDTEAGRRGLDRRDRRQDRALRGSAALGGRLRQLRAGHGREPARELRVADPGVPDAAARPHRGRGPARHREGRLRLGRRVQPLGRLRRRRRHLHDAVRALRQRRTSADAARAR